MWSEGWLLLIIFLSVALIVIGRIQYGLTQAKARERETVFMYELSTALAAARSPEIAARTLARHLQQLYQAELVRVNVHAAALAAGASVQIPSTRSETRQPDLIVPLLAARSLIGEVCLWGGQSPLPQAENRLIQNFAIQTANALERLHAPAV